MTGVTMPWATTQLLREITNASQNTGSDQLFMEKKSQNFLLRSNVRQNLEGGVNSGSRQRKAEALTLQNHGEALELP